MLVQSQHSRDTAHTASTITLVASPMLAPMRLSLRLTAIVMMAVVASDSMVAVGSLPQAAPNQRRVFPALPPAAAPVRPSSPNAAELSLPPPLTEGEAPPPLSMVQSMLDTGSLAAFRWQLQQHSGCTKIDEPGFEVRGRGGVGGERSK